MTHTPRRESRADNPVRSGPRRPRRRARAAAVALLTAVALVASGCSIQIESQPDPSIPDDTMLIGADNGSPMFEKNFNPYLANKRIGAFYIYEPLTVINNLDGKGTPWLAASTEQPDASTIVFTLREGVKWSDGKAFTARDVDFTFQLLKKYPTLDMLGAWQYIDTVETSGNTVTIHLSQPDVPAANLIAQTRIVPEHIWKDVKDPGTFRNVEPVGTGPYTLGNFAPQQYTLDKNKRYWQADKVAAEHLVLPASNTQLDTVSKGYDWAYQYISDVEGTWGAANKDNKYWFPPGGTIAMLPNLTKAPFNDINFRQGLSHAIDRDKIADAATEGYMQGAGQNNLLLPNQKDFLSPDLPNDGKVTQNTALALEYFAKAGYTPRDGKLVDAAGKPLEFSLMTANGYTDWLRAVQQIQKQLGDIGITVKVVQPQPAAYQLAMRNGEYDMTIGAIGGTGDVYRDFNGLLSSEFVVPAGEEATNNFERFSDPAVDDILAKFRVAIDEKDQLDYGYQLQKVMYDQVPAIGVYYGGSWGLYNTTKFTGWPTAENPYASLMTYESTPLLIFTSLKKTQKDGE
ncbi:ABC transporter substrate-binding protein [Okibacterium fritillariae]|nr:ABC transporter substrate-binding protein [Okibacterium fritillariae]